MLHLLPFTFWHIFKIRKTKCVRIPNFVKIGQYFAKLWRYVYFRGRSQNLRRHTKFGQNRLNLLPVYFLTHFEDYGGKMCLHTKFHANRTIFGEVITFHKFSRWRPARSRDIIICNSGPHTKSPPRCSELAVQIWFWNLDYFWIYRNFSILSLCM